MKKNSCTIGIDIGGTKVLLSLYDREFRIIEESKFKTKVGEGRKSFEVALKKNMRSLMKVVKKQRRSLLCVGIGCAGVIDSKAGKVLESPNIPFLASLSLTRIVHVLSGVPVHIINDVRAGLYGEFKLGVA